MDMPNLEKDKVAVSHISAQRRFRRPPRTLVVGGAGFIGSHVVESLLERGCKVRVLDDLSSGKLSNLPINHPNLELRIGSILDYETVYDAMHGMRRCIHLAAQVSAPLSVEEPRESAMINVIGFINILEAVRALHLERLVYASSAAVYGDCPNLPLLEDETPRPNNPYGLEKHIDELYADLYARQYGISALGLRFFNVYGPRQDPASSYSGVISKFLDCLNNGRAPIIFGDGKQTRDFIHVTDIARACTSALNLYCDGVCNVATGKQVDLLRMTDILGKALDVAVAPEFGPERVGDIRHSCGDAERLDTWLQCPAAVELDRGLTELALAYQKQHAATGTDAIPLGKARGA
jgi:UDP-glucose 4-epimerase